MAQMMLNIIEFSGLRVDDVMVPRVDIVAIDDALTAQAISFVHARALERISVSDVAKHIGVDSLGYISLDGMLNAVPGGPTGFCDSCFTGKYPTPAPTVTAKQRLG